MRPARVARVVLKVLAFVVLGVVVLIGAALTVLHTRWGKEQVRARAESAVNEMLAGRLSVGTVEGSFFDRLVLRDIALFDAAGREALRAESVIVDFDLYSLLSKLALIDEVIIEKPRALLVTEADGTLNVTKLMKEATEEPAPAPTEPSAWTVRIDSARLHNGEVRYVAADGSTLAASALELDANAKLGGDDAAIDVHNLSTNIAETARRHALALRFKATKDGLQTELRDLALAIDGTEPTVRVELARYHLESQKLDVSFAANASKALLVKLTQDQAWRGGIAVSGDIHRASSNAPWSAVIAGELAGQTPFTASATSAADFSRAEVTASVSRLDPAAIYATLPPGKIQLRLDADVRGKSLRDLEGTVALQGSGSIQRHQISRLELDAKAARGRIEADVRALLRGAGSIDATALVDTNTEPLTLTRADAKVRLKNIAPLLPKGSGIRGAVVADVHASGRLDDLLANGTVSVQQFSSGAAHVDRARLRFDLRQSPAALTVNVRELYATEKGVELNLRNSQVSLANDVLVVKNASFDTNAGDAELSARIHTRRLLKGPGEAHLTFRELNLPRLRAAFFPSSPAITGIAGGQLDVRLDNSGPHATFKGSVREIAVREKMPPVALELSATVEGPNAHADVAVTGKNLGKMTALADVRAPGDPTSPETWAKISERAIERAWVGLQKVPVKTLMSYARPADDVTGTIDGELELLRRGENFRADVRVVGVRAEPLPMPIDVELHTKTESGRILNTLGVAMKKDVVLTANVNVEHDLARLKKLGFASFADADLDGDVTLDEFPLVMFADATEALASMKKAAEPGTRAIRRSPKGKRLGLGTVEGTSGFDGVASATLVFKRRQRETNAKFELHGRDLVWVNDAPKLDLELIATLENGALIAKGYGRGKAVGGIDLDAALDLPRDVFDGAAWANVDERAIQKMVFKFDALKLGEADKIANRRFGLLGIVDGEVHVARGTKFANVELELKEVRNKKMATGVDGRLRARVDQSRSMISIDTSHEGKKMLVGKIETSASIRELLRGGEKQLAEQKIDGVLTIEKLPLPLLQQMLRSHHDMSGAFSGKAIVFGSIGAPAVEIELNGAGTKIDEHAFRELTVHAKIDPSRIEADAHISETRGGHLDLTANIGRKVDHREVKARLEASKFPLGWLTALIPPSLGIGGIAGRLDGEVDLTGQLGDPDVRGRIQFVDLKIGLAPPAPMLERAKLDMTFDGRKIAMNLDGHSGDGDIKAELTADLKRLDAPDFDARITTDELPIAVGPKQLLLDSVTRIKGRTEDVMQIEVVVERGTVDIPNEGSEQYRRIAKLDDIVYLGDEKVIEVEAGEAFPKMLVLVGLRKQIPLRGDEINAVGDVELQLSNKSGTMEMSGYATVGNGYLNLFGKRWDIQQARIDFIPGEEPRVQVELTHDFETAMVYLRVIGSPEHPELIVSSDPPIYDEAQLLMFVIGSGPNEDPNQTSMRGQAAGIAANALLGEVQSKLEDELPIDTLQLDLTDGAVPARLRLGRWVTSRLFLGYDYDFKAEDDENSNEAVLQYRLGRGWMVESRYGDRGNGGVDAVWVKRF